MTEEEKREMEGWVKLMIDSYKPKIWKSCFQKFWFWMTEFFTPIFKYRDRKNQIFWNIIQPYRRKIVDAYENHKKFSDECSYLKGDGEALKAIRLILAEKEEIDKLTAELQQKLNEARWPYRSLPGYRDLVFFQNGNVFIDNALKYWKEIANFFLHRPFHLLS